jgi:ABC-type transport system involved in multi-copper enzyme maturation permease subunit
VEKTPGLRRAKLAMGAGFAIFLLLAARTFHFIFYAKPSWQASGMSACYLLFSLACFGLAIWLAIKKPQTTESKQDPSAPQLPARP